MEASDTSDNVKGDGEDKYHKKQGHGQGSQAFSQITITRTSVHQRARPGAASLG